jgi:predicted TIM-barrel fold metal-dependent hydrolase
MSAAADDASAASPAAPDASGGWDCHAHVFGPYDRYPLAEGRAYTPPEAPPDAYLAHLDALGLARGVLVHPSAYGLDHRRVLDILAARPQLRGVLVSPPAGQPGALPSLAGLRERGVRALRYSARGGAASNFAGSAAFEELEAMAGALADAGLHAELWTDRHILPGIADRIRALPVPVVIDHMAGFDVAAGIDEPGFRCLLDLLAEGRAWVKLCAYRNLLALPDRGRWAEALAPYQQALQRAHPEHLVWGSDWPYLNVKEPPSGDFLLRLLHASVGDAAIARTILRDNPARLYG